MNYTKHIVALFAGVIIGTAGGACGGGDVCGDDICGESESVDTCAQDCPCGDGVCGEGETFESCPADCTCGDDVCDPAAGETFEACPADCTCGDGVCEEDEDDVSCHADCHCGNGLCEASLEEDDTNCAEDCLCGNGTCDDTEGETYQTCSIDCPAPGCGDGVCAADELSPSCPQDCDPCTTTAENIGQACTAGCGQGGFCAGADQASLACHQVCIPNVCDDLCAEGEVCAATGQNLSDGRPLGACVVQEAGTQGAYEACGQADGNCQAGLSCAAFVQGATVGTCTPSCTGQGSTCPAYSDGTAGVCFLVTTQGATTPDGCGIRCLPENPTCPTGMTCTDLGGAGVCHW